MTEPARSSDNPFIGPVHFKRDGTAGFFGREQETRELVSYIVSQPAVLLYSPSGAGKSSLVNAGVIPRLEEKYDFDVPTVARVRGVADFASADRATCFYTYQAIRSMDPDVAGHAAESMTLAEFLASRPRQLDADGADAPRLLVFDQFEEVLSVYAHNSYEHQTEFFRQVAQALRADPLLRVLWVVREDRLSQLEGFAPLLPHGLGLRYRLQHLTREAARRAVLRTTEKSVKRFSEAAADAVVGQLLKTRAETRPGFFELVDGNRVEPVQLQVVCESIWGRAAPGEIGPSDLIEFGDIGDVLAAYYDRAVTETVRNTHVDEADLREWFSRRLITELHTRGTVFRGSTHTDQVIPIPNAVVDELEKRHVVRAEQHGDGAGQWYELVHDTFIDPILTANAKWERRGEPRRVTAVRVAAPLAIVAAYAALGSLAIDAVLTRAGTDTTRPQFSGDLADVREAARHPVRVLGRGAVAMSAVATTGAVRDLVLVSQDGQEHGAEDLDDGPGFRAVVDDLPAGQYVLVVSGARGEVTKYQGWTAEGAMLAVGDLVEEDLAGHGNEFILVGDGRPLVLRAQSGQFDTVLSAGTVDLSAQGFYNDDHELGLDDPVQGSATDASGTGQSSGGGPAGGDGDAVALRPTDSVLSLPTQQGQVYRIAVRSFGDWTAEGTYTLATFAPAPPQELTAQAQQSGRLEPQTSAGFNLDPLTDGFSVVSPDGGDLAVQVQSQDGEVIVDEIVSGSDRAGVSLALDPGPARVLTITSHAGTTASYELVVTAAGAAP